MYIIDMFFNFIPNLSILYDFCILPNIWNQLEYNYKIARVMYILVA